jgi:N-acetylneuraminic acid mutarotase
MTRWTRLTLGLASAFVGISCHDNNEGPTEPEAMTSPAADMSVVAASNTWATKRSLSPWRMSMPAGTINGIIYVVGGRGRAGAPLARVDAYNVATNTWSQVASLPSARAHLNGASMINGKLYVTGGSDMNGTWTRTLFVYNPGTNSWSRKADMPRASCDGDQGVIAGQLYVYTGCFAAKNLGRVFFRYNPAMNTWVVRAAPRFDHSSGAGAVVNGKFYLAGGYDLVEASPTNSEFEELNGKLEVYNPATNSWMTRAPMSRSKAGMAGAALNGKLYLAGGASSGGEFPENTLQAYDPMTNMWMMKAPMPTRHSQGAATMAGGRLFTIWGYEYLEPSDTPSRVYAYTP